MIKSTDHGEQTKRNIAGKAKNLFELKGYAATTMDEIRQLSFFFCTSLNCQCSSGSASGAT